MSAGADDPVGVTKAAGEMFAAVYANLYGLDITSLRVTEVYGPGNGACLPQMLNEVHRYGAPGGRISAQLREPIKLVSVRTV